MAAKYSYFHRRIRSFAHAFRGIRTALQSQPNFRIQLLAGLAAITLAFWLHISALEWMAILIACTLVLGAEAFNSALEMLCNKIEPGFDESIKAAKDMAAGAVLIFSIGALIIGGIIFIPKLVDAFTKL